MEKTPVLPIPTVKRFPSYLRILHACQEKGDVYISATVLAEELGLKPIQVRKDISYTGLEGKPKVGFEIRELIKVLNHVLGWDNTSEAVIIGAGNLGSALARYAGFKAYGLKMAGIFDNDRRKIGKNIGSLTVLSMDDLAAFIHEHRIVTAVITVPASVAQEVADFLMAEGIKAIWNFAPIDLKVLPSVALQRTDLATALAVLSVKMQNKLESSEEDI
ncbi:MAG: redox-sensing transcriptional repressor Rex [Bullifex sp.]